MLLNQFLSRLAQPMQFGRMPGYPMPEQPFRATYRAFPVAAANKEKLEAGDKVILPPSALDHLTQIHVQYPMLFRLSPAASANAAGAASNASPPRHTHCGVMEFSSEEGVMYMPFWMMQNLLIEVGALVDVVNVKLTSGKFVKLQPHTTAFTQLHNPRVVLEKALRGFSVLTQGDTIAIQHGTENFYLDVVETRPGVAISVIETDVQVEFAPPKDFKEGAAPAPAAAAASSSSAAAAAGGPLSPASAAKGHFRFSSHDAHAGQTVQKSDFSASSSSSGAESKTSSASAAPAGAAASGGDYFSKLKGGYKLKTGKKLDETPNAAAAASPVSAATSSSSLPSAASGAVGAKQIVQEIQGRFMYIYEVEGDKKRLVRRVPAPQTPASAAAKNKPAGSAAAPAAAASAAAPATAASASSAAAASSNPFAGKKGYSLK